MKIDFVVGKLSPNSGGGERVLRDVAVELARRGHIVRVLSYSPGLSGTGYYQFPSDVEHINLSNVSKGLGSALKQRIAKFISIKEGPLLSESVRETVFLWRQNHFCIGLLNAWKESPPDISVGYMGNGVCVASEVVAKLERELPLFASLHASPFRLFNDNSAKSRLTKKAISKVKRVGFPLREHREGLQDFTDLHFVTLPNPVDIPDRDFTHKREKKIIAVGRLVGLKRIDKLLYAWGEISKEFPDWHIDILGSGPELIPLQIQARALGIEGQVCFRGEVVDIFDEYEKASLLVHPSKYEGFGLVIAEALGRGVPVVGFKGVPGIQSLVVNGVNGILVSPNGDSNSLAKTMYSLLSDREKLKKLSVNTRSTVEKYRLQNSVDVWERELLAAANDI